MLYDSLFCTFRYHDISGITSFQFRIDQKTMENRPCFNALSPPLPPSSLPAIPLTCLAPHPPSLPPPPLSQDAHPAAPGPLSGSAHVRRRLCPRGRPAGAGGGDHAGREGAGLALGGGREEGEWDRARHGKGLRECEDLRG